MIRFGPDDLALFAAASHDVNPLHLSADYARRTPFGEPVVFGVLGALAALGTLPAREGRELAGLSLIFRQPLFAGVDYRVDAGKASADSAKLSVRDASRILISATFHFREARPGGDPIGEPGTAPRASAEARGLEELASGATASGEYAVAPGPFRALVDRWGLAGKGATDAQLASMLWASYLVGMELPGERALFARLKIEFAADRAAGAGPFSYEARADELDPRFDLLGATARLGRGGRPFAEVDLGAYARRDLPGLSRDRIAGALAPSDALRGKVALVTGGSRGLGAAIAGALALQGADVVVNYRSGTAEAERLRSEFGAAIVPVQADASVAEGCARLRREVVDRFGGLDVLVCNATPPLRAAGFGPGSGGRLLEFVAESLALAAGPLAEFLDLLEARSGWDVLISTAFCSESNPGLPPDFHHYVAAKSAAEGMVRSLARHHEKARHLIVRPPRLLTDQTNTPTGREGALAVEGVAAAIVRRLGQPGPSGGVEVMEDFPADGPG